MNSYVFFKATVQHWQDKKITSLKDEKGTVVETHKDIEHTLTNHFKKLMEETDMDRNSTIEEIIENIPSIVTQEKKKLLLQPIEMAELEEALK